MTPGASLPGDLIPIPRPHFRLRGEALYFLISERPSAVLSEEERRVWQALDGKASVGELRARFPGGAEVALRRFHDLRLCELVPGRFPEGRRRVLVLEAHMDDGVLSVGGTMWQRREECEFTLVTFCGQTNFTSYSYIGREYFDVDEVSALRRAETEVVVRLLGGHHHDLGLPEAPLRYWSGRWTADWYRRHRGSISAFIAHPSGPEELRTWTAAIREVLRGARAEEVWVPLGVAPHTDHQLARDAALAVLMAEPTLLQRFSVFFYQGVPYALQFRHHTDALVSALATAGGRLEPEIVRITEVFPDKLRLLSIFGSQFKSKWVDPRVEACARLAADGADGLAELLLRVVALPPRLDPLALNMEAETVRRAKRALVPWSRRHRAARRMRILLRAPAGRWREDMGDVLRLFPHTRFEVFASDMAIAEVQELVSERISVRCVGSGKGAWVRLAARIAIGAPGPILFIPGPDLMRPARLLSALWPLSDTLVVPALHHFSLAWRLALASGEVEASAA